MTAVRPTGILSSGEDITERRRAEESLRVSELRFRQIAENLSEVFWITNADKTKVEYVSPAYETVWGRTVEEVYDRPIVVPGSDRARGPRGDGKAG